MAIWEAPLCPYRIEFAPEKLDEVRLAVIDAFYSLPRGGLEIGGVLFGTHAAGRVDITDYRHIECQHLTGPSFHLSEKDKAGLKRLLAETPMEPVGWFHSHTRSEISLTPQDLDLYAQFFPEPWQVALVLKPENMRPVRAGYFFRGANGQIQADASCKEFILEPVFNGLPHPGTRRPEPVAKKLEAVPTKTVSQPLPPEPAKPVAPVPPEPESPLAHPPKSRRGLTIAIAGIAFLAILSGFIVGTKSRWIPGPSAPLHLFATDASGKLLIRWDSGTPTIQNAVIGVLTVNDGGKETQVSLDPVELTRGFYLVPRQTRRADVKLKISVKDAQPVEEITSFAGPIMTPDPTPAEIEAKQRAAELERRHEKTKADLASQASRNRALQREMKNLRDRIGEAPKQ